VRVGTGERIEQTIIIDRAGRAQDTRLLAELLGEPRILQDAAAADCESPRNEFGTSEFGVIETRRRVLKSAFLISRRRS